MAANNSTFTCFAKLPKELRDMIWIAAIRPAQPGVHFFTIFNLWVDRDRWAIGDDAAVADPECSDISAVAAPCCNRSEPTARSWTASNPSTYLIDGGLLTACKESREAMNKHVRAVEGGHRSDLDKNYDQSKDPDAATTASFLLDGERWFFRVKPELDLFIVQPYDFNSLDDWDTFGHHAYIFGRCHAGHIALEYDPKWASDLSSERGDFPSAEGALGCVSRATTDQASWVDHLWLIDYRIRRRPEESLPVEKRHIFYGVGCRYVEVQPYDPGWDWGPYDYPDDVFSFKHSLDEDSHYDDGPDDFQRFESDGYAWGPMVGILACERDV
ncbi:hypothetical protein DL771_012455 [Monosporascus sp. 5C6A]|nr:hypothetical protein DL771_012455 [Monosporascus sp. 5C6A]